MPAPEVTITWDDKSAINSLSTISQDEVDRPIFMSVFSSDKGPEEWKTRVFGDDFFTLYGATPSFKKHGQPLIQAANVIQAGGYLTCKRVVAKDATLANIGVVANVTTSIIQKTDSNGNLLWRDNITGNDTTSRYDSNGSANQKATKNHVDIQYELKSVVLPGNDPKLFGNAFYAANKHNNAVGTSGHYALFLIMDNGRGASSKRFRIYRDTSSSKPVTYTRYFIDVIENGNVLETIPFTMNPSVIENDRNMSLYSSVKTKSKQIRAEFFDSEFEAFAENVSNLASLADSEYAYTDSLFATDEYGNAYEDITVASTPNLGTTYGIQLENGSDGEFTGNAIDSADYPSQVRSAFDGSYDDIVYDLDNNRIDCVFDANYPQVVKSAIEQMVNFREDCMFFRDLGTNIRNIEDVKLAYSSYNVMRSKFVAVYMNSYDIYDPYTKKEINVTVTYDLARLFVKHFINGRSRPFCGQKYDVIIPTLPGNNVSSYVIDGTLNFFPKHTPKLNQKEELDTLRVNYCTYYDGNILTMDTEYTSQVEYTQLSWLNNVLEVQEVIKAIRSLCPKIRYSFMDGDDITQYKKDVQDVLDKYTSKFKSLTIEYVEDAGYASNKIIYAVIYVQFRNFIQTEHFRITALQS